MSDETQPTSEWEHSHALNEGDELGTEYGERYEVVRVRDDGAVNVRRIDGNHGDAGDTDTWGERAVTSSLANGEVERVSDGKSHELATF